LGRQRREHARRAARARFQSRVIRALWASGAGLGAVAIVAEWTGLGSLSGPIAIGAVATVVLAFVPITLPSATDEQVMGGDSSGSGFGFGGSGGGD
jgi:uncharacterized membrane protein YhhN